jgi:hypothetical protein
MATSKPPRKIRDKTALLNAGLGEASIQFFLDMSRLECHDKILERFPKLKETGYEILLFQRGMTLVLLILVVHKLQGG